MASKLVFFFVLLCAIEISLAAVAIGFAPIKDPKLRAQGYTCNESDCGPMKDGEVNNNFSQRSCGKVSCMSGYLDYEFCISYEIEGEPNRPMDPTKPFPECCNYPF